MFDRSQQPNTRTLGERLCALPFELNAKISDLHLNIGSHFVVAALRRGERIERHKDNTEKPENGRTLTTALFVGEGGSLEISDQPKTNMASGSLALLKSRRVTWAAANESADKIFVILFFISGPVVLDWSGSCVAPNSCT